MLSPSLMFLHWIISCVFFLPPKPWVPEMVQHSNVLWTKTVSLPCLPYIFCILYSKWLVNGPVHHSITLRGHTEIVTTEFFFWGTFCHASPIPAFFIYISSHFMILKMQFPRLGWLIGDTRWFCNQLWIIFSFVRLQNILINVLHHLDDRDTKLDQRKNPSLENCQDPWCLFFKLLPLREKTFNPSKVFFMHSK